MSKDQDYAALARKRLEESLKERDIYEVEVLGKTFKVYPDVFSPKYFIDTEFFAENIHVEPGEQFLEIGSGTGVISVVAALQDAQVTATDINKRAILNTAANALLHGVQDKIVVLEGNLFDPIQSKKFDTIFWNVPFNHVAGDVSEVELAIFDPQDRYKRAFVEAAGRYLNVNGRLLIGFSSNYGDFEHLQRLLKENGFAWSLIAEKTENFNGDIMNLELIEANRF